EIRRIEERLNEAFEFAHFWEEHHGNPDSNKFSPINANYNRYDGMLAMLESMGYVWKRINGLHTVYKK
ncbi:MAG TPA: hypothetical protein GX717_01175, partial [Clostridiaceae bacterium]|nr:hypothetical protein [Clostridiaceae bacterium]